MKDRNNIEILKQALSSKKTVFKVIFKEDFAIQKYQNLERGEKGTPAIALIPNNNSELEEIIKILNECNFSAVIFAGNTGLVSAQRADSEAIIDLNKLDNLEFITLKNEDKFIFSKQPENVLGTAKAENWRAEFSKWIVEKNYTKADFENAALECEAGVPFGTINYVLEPSQIEVPVDTGAVWVGGGMTAGAAVANASHGTYGLLHGKASDLVIECKSINGDGTWRTDKSRGGRPVALNEEEVMINSAKAQYGDSAIGTQGTFAIITNIKFATKILPEFRHYFLIKVQNISEVNKIRKILRKNFTNKLLQFEIMDRKSMKIVKDFEPDNFVNPFYDFEGKPLGSGVEVDSNYVIMAQIICFADEEFYGYAAFDLLTQDLKINENDIAYAGSNGGDPEEFIKLRHSITGASTKYSKQAKGRITLDVSAPLLQIENYIDDIQAYIKGQGLEVALFGHIGIGSLHLHIFLKNGEFEKQKIIEDIFEITKNYNGSCWSEHGVGTANAKLYKKYTAPEIVEEWLSYKNKYDPNNILSPRSNGF